MRKKLLAMALVLCTVLAVFPTGALAADEADVEDKWDVVSLGSYPQSIVTDQQLITQLESKTPDTNSDITLGNARYKARTTNNSTSYYQYEPVEWIVLSTIDGKSLLMSKKIISANQLSASWDTSAWSNSTLRDWLNSDFMNDVFTSDEQSIIYTTHVETERGDPTEDKLFLPSVSELENESYGFSSSEDRKASQTAYADAMGAVECYLTRDTHTNWFGYINGVYGWNGQIVSTMTDVWWGIRPCVNVDISKIDTISPDPNPTEPDSAGDSGSDPTGEKVYFTALTDTITSNRGDRFLPTAVTLENGEAVPDGTKVVYLLDGRSGHGYVQDGVISFPVFGSAGKHTIKVTSVYGGYKVATPYLTVQTEYEDLSYSETMDMSLSIEFSPEISDFLGVKAATANGVSMTYSEDNGEKSLSMTNSANATALGSLTAPGEYKQFASKISGTGALSPELKSTMEIKDFDTSLKDDVQQGLIGYFLLRSVSGGLGDASQQSLKTQFYNMYGVNVDNYLTEKETASGALKLSAGQTVSFMMGDEKFKLSAPSKTLTASGKLVRNTGSKETTWSASISSDDKGSALEGPWLLGVSSTIWATDMNRKTATIEVANDSSHNVKSVSSISSDKNYDGIIGSTKQATTTKTVTYEGTAAQTLVENNENLKKLSTGARPFMRQADMNDVFQAMSESQDIASYTDTITYADGFDFSVGSTLKASASGIKSYDFTMNQGVVYQGKSYLIVDGNNAYTETMTDGLGYSGPSMIALGLDGLNAFLGQAIRYAAGKVVDGIKSNASALWGNVTSGWNAVISSVTGNTNNGSLRNSVKLSAVSDSGEAIQSVMVGDAYIVRVFTDESHDTAVTDEELAVSPLTLSLAYTTEDLTEAGVITESNIAMYHWNETLNIYQYVSGCSVDTTNKTVTASITQNGEYVLAVDTEAPIVINFQVSNGTALPTITANVSNFDGLSAGTLSVDGTVLISDANINQYFDAATGTIQYGFSTPLTAGAHTASLVLTDTSGNTMEIPSTITWTVDVVAPTISNVQIANQVDWGDALAICAEVEDTNLSIVYAQVTDGDSSEIIDLNKTDSGWETSLTCTPDSGSVTILISAVDEAGNVSTSEPVTVTVNNTPAEHTHTYLCDTLEPTCSEAGIHVYKCSICGKRYTESLPAAGHTWDSGKITVSPTKTTPGIKTYTCTVCGETKTESIAATDTVQPVSPVAPTAPITPTVSAYIDVPTNAWYYSAVQYVTENNLMTGYGEGKFGPTDNLTRAQLAQILYNKEGKPAVTAESSFDDVAPGAWYYDAVVWAAENGVVKGYGNGKFGPNDNVTREQLATMLYRYAGEPETAGTLDGFTDAGKVSSYAEKAMQWAVETGIVNGKGDGIIDPKGNTTRAEVATMMMRFCENVAE